jgi:hypothetical protein
VKIRRAGPASWLGFAAALRGGWSGAGCVVGELAAREWVQPGGWSVAVR